MDSGATLAERLAPLREDLTISEGAINSNGQPTWCVYDSLRHRFVAIDHATCTILSMWTDQLTAGQLSAAASVRLNQPVTASEIDELARFLARHDLTLTSGDDWRKQLEALKKLRHNALMSLVHNYLFFKVPVFSPEKFLQRTIWISDFAAKRSVHWLIALLGFTGLLLVSRQWDEFLLGARGLMTAAGMAQFAITLFCVKILHEFGHAYTAMRHGCRVPVIGVAFMMMAPVLYTDVTDSWRLTDRRQRFAIDIAGIGVELALACLATFLWVFLPDGLTRQVAFMIATTSWIMSIGINLNPCMRFDGYYIMSDFLRVENLQSRSFDLGVWKMREILFKLNAMPPEVMSARRVNLLVFYAWSVWVYRVILFTGIAFIVYEYFFKALGLTLFAFEIGYFLVKPAYAEVSQWWAMRKELVNSNRALLTLGLAIVLATLFIIPWSSTIKIPAILEAVDVAQIYPPRSGRIIAVHAVAGQTVRKGDRLLQLGSADLDAEQNITRIKLDAVQRRLERILSDKEDRDDSLVLEGAARLLRMKLDGLIKEQQELDIRAPANGMIAEMNRSLQPGQWIGEKERIALLRGTEHVAITGYVAESDLYRIEVGALGRFIPDMPQGSAAEAILQSIAVSGATQIEPPELASANGGRIEAYLDNRQRLVPVTAQYSVKLTVAGPVPVPSVRLRGVVNVQGAAESFFAATWRRVLKVLVRESAA